MSRLSLKKLGPGLLFAGAAIGVSHLVQSTRAGADYGFGLVWALLLIHLIKYPFFQYGPRYAAVTKESLLEGYLRLGKGALIVFFVINLLTMFTIQTAVTIVTAGIAGYLFGFEINIATWSAIITLVCALILIVGQYNMLDILMKVIILTLTVSTMVAVCVAYFRGSGTHEIAQVLPTDTAGIAFLIAFMGWMPAPLDISIWHSLWALEKSKKDSINDDEAIFDFNVGYAGTIIIGLCFIGLGAIVMFNSGTVFSPSGTVFAQQLIEMYTGNLGEWAFIIIGIAALTTMFSTTLTTLDASPRAMSRTVDLLWGKKMKYGYLFWILILMLGTCAILFFLISEMGQLVQIATILSFLTAPFYALMNFIVMNGKNVPRKSRPTLPLQILSIMGIVILIAFSIWYLASIV
ncbi:MAG: iron transporter [Cytophagaceae bacterium]|nr:iron transporter [Cytophagaceae bacterium]